MERCTNIMQANQYCNTCIHLGPYIWGVWVAWLPVLSSRKEGIGMLGDKGTCLNQDPGSTLHEVIWPLIVGT